MSEENFNKLREIVGTQLGIEKDKITLDSNFTKELGADSLDVVELVMAFEESFEIDIDDDAAGKITTVKDALDYINESK